MFETRVPIMRSFLFSFFTYESRVTISPQLLITIYPAVTNRVTTLFRADITSRVVFYFFRCLVNRQQLNLQSSKQRARYSVPEFISDKEIRTTLFNHHNCMISSLMFFDVLWCLYSCIFSIAFHRLVIIYWCATERKRSSCCPFVFWIKIAME